MIFNKIKNILKILFWILQQTSHMLSFTNSLWIAITLKMHSKVKVKSKTFILLYSPIIQIKHYILLNKVNKYVILALWIAFEWGQMLHVIILLCFLNALKQLMAGDAVTIVIMIFYISTWTPQHCDGLTFDIYFSAYA